MMYCSAKDFIGFLPETDDIPIARINSHHGHCNIVRFGSTVYEVYSLNQKENVN